MLSSANSSHAGLVWLIWMLEISAWRTQLSHDVLIRRKLGIEARVLHSVVILAIFQLNWRSIASPHRWQMGHFISRLTKICLMPQTQLVIVVEMLRNAGVSIGSCLTTLNSAWSQHGLWQISLQSSWPFAMLSTSGSPFPLSSTRGNNMALASALPHSETGAPPSFSPSVHRLVRDLAGREMSIHLAPLTLCPLLSAFVRCLPNSLVRFD